MPGAIEGAVVKRRDVAASRARIACVLSSVLLLLVVSGCGSTNKARVLGVALERTTTTSTVGVIAPSVVRETPTSALSAAATSAPTPPSASSMPSATPTTRQRPVVTAVTTTVPSDDRRVVVTLAPPPVAGAESDVRVRVDGDIQPWRVDLDFGDGRTTSLYGAGSNESPAVIACDPPQAFDVGVPHAWRASAAYRVTVVAVYCHEDAVSASAVVSPRPASGRVASNGPAPPVFDAAAGVVVRAGSWVSGTVVDDDGWLETISVDWGDGSPPETVLGSAPPDCRDDATRWPSSTFQIDASHDYAGPAPSTAIVRVTSTGCDGASRQEAAIVVRLT
jgi:hypothetical protein